MADHFAEIKINAFLENNRIRLEGDDSAVLFCLADLLASGFPLALRIFLYIDVAVLVDQNLSTNRQSIDHRSTDAVETTGNFVAGIVAAKLASGMEHSHNHFESRDLCLLVYIDGNTAAVVHHAHLIARQKSDFDVIGKSAHGLVAGVVEYLGDEVVQAVRPRRADIHARPLADRL